MALSDAQRAEIEALAKAEGFDPEKLIAEAERLHSPPTKPGQPRPPGKGAPPGSASSHGAPCLPSYMLPFLTVKEARATFLGLEAPFVGDSEIASDWATRHPVPDDDDGNDDEGKPSDRSADDKALTGPGTSV